MSGVLPLVVDATSPETQSLDEESMRTILVGTYGDDVIVKDTMDAICTRLEENNQTVMLKTLVVLHRVLRDGHQPLIAQGVQESSDRLIHMLDQQQELPAHWTDAALISAYRQYLGVRLTSTVDMRQEDKAKDGSSVDASVGRFRHLTMDELFVEMPKLQSQLALLLECQDTCCATAEGSAVPVGLDRDMVARGFAMMMKDAFSLHRCASEGVVNLLEHFFTLERAAAMQGVDLYKKFMSQTDRVIGMHAAARQLPPSISGPYPDLQPAPPSLLSALEEYINQVSSDTDQIAVTLSASTNRDVGAFSGLTGLSSIGGGSFALSSKQLDQVLVKIEKLERAVKEGQHKPLSERAQIQHQELNAEVTRLEGAVADRQKALDTLRGSGGFFGFGGKKKDASEQEREQAAESALTIAQGELNQAKTALDEATAAPMDALRGSAEDRVNAELRELKELVVQVAASANEALVKQQIKQEALEAIGGTPAGANELK